MEIMKTEVEAIEQAIVEANTSEVRVLNDLQLALVGGGIGDVVFA